MVNIKEMRSTVAIYSFYSLLLLYPEDINGREGQAMKAIADQQDGLSDEQITKMFNDIEVPRH